MNKYTTEQYERVGFHVHPGIEERRAASLKPGAFKALSEPEKAELMNYEQLKRQAATRIGRVQPVQTSEFD